MARILPAHEQHYPDKVMATRLEEYVFDDGRPPTQNRAYAVRVTGQQTLDSIIAAQKELCLSNIDPRYFVGTCFHEAGCSNEWDTEKATASCPPGFVSVGAYQIGEEEAHRFGFQLADMLDFDKSSKCMVRLAEANLAQLRSYIAANPGKPHNEDYTDPSGKLWVQGGVRAYLAIGHNHGMGYVRQTIASYGLDWPAYKARNPTDNIVSHAYGEDCVTGGSYWPGGVVPVPPGHRTLMLADPYMTGDDVKELQRYLKIKDDGTFGPLTDSAVKIFQKGVFIKDDGIVGPVTWGKLLATT